MLPLVDGVRHGFAVVGGARIHYAEAGEGEPLVLLHGWPQHWWSFRKIIGPLSKRYRVICPDIRGLGWSGGSPAGYRFIDLATDLVGLLDVLGLKRVRLLGHDWGQLAGYITCLRWPERVEKFVALAGVTPWSADGAPWRLYLRPWHIWTIAMLGRFAMRKFSLPERALRTWRSAGLFTPEEMDTYLGPLRRPEAEDATVRFDRSVLFRELPYFLRHYKSMRLRTPALHINGANDPLTIGVPNTYRRYADAMRLELIADCGHFIPEEKPEELLDRVWDFFGRR